jgi:hypothetical protein
LSETRRWFSGTSLRNVPLLSWSMGSDAGTANLTVLPMSEGSAITRSRTIYSMPLLKTLISARSSGRVTSGNSALTASRTILRQLASNGLSRLIWPSSRVISTVTMVWTNA